MNCFHTRKVNRLRCTSAKHKPRAAQLHVAPAGESANLELGRREPQPPSTSSSTTNELWPPHLARCSSVRRHSCASLQVCMWFESAAIGGARSRSSAWVSLHGCSGVKREFAQPHRAHPPSSAAQPVSLCSDDCCGTAVATARDVSWMCNPAVAFTAHSGNARAGFGKRSEARFATLYSGEAHLHTEG